MSIKLTAVIQREDDIYVAKCLENSVASQGDTVESAMHNLREALELYFEDNVQEAATYQPAFVTTLDVAI